MDDSITGTHDKKSTALLWAGIMLGRRHLVGAGYEYEGRKVCWSDYYEYVIVLKEGYIVSLMN